MAVFLKILSLIGIVLLSILALLLLLVLIVLLVPIHYKANGYIKDNAIDYKGRASWLFSIISVSFSYGQENPEIRIFGFKKKKKKEKEEKEEEKKISEKNQIKTEEEIDVSALNENTLNENNQDILNSSTKSEEDSENIFEESQDDIKKTEEYLSFEDEENQDLNKKSFYDKLKRYIKIIESKRFKIAFKYAKNKAFKLLKELLPKRLKIEAEIGFDDPSLTGKLIAITSMLIPITQDKIIVKGNFTEKHFEASGRLKGHITVIKVLWILGTAYFNKNLRKVIKLFKEE